MTSEHNLFFFVLGIFLMYIGYKMVTMAIKSKSIPSKNIEESNYCRIVGHKFNRIEIKDNIEMVYPSDHCRNCGITKKELERLKKK